MALTLRTLRLRVLRGELEKATAAGDSKGVFRANNAIARMLRKPRPKGTQPDSYHGRRAAAADAVLVKRQAARAAQLAEYRDRKNASLPVPIEIPAVIECPADTIKAPTSQDSEPRKVDTSDPVAIPPTPLGSVAAIRQAAEDRPAVDEMAGYRPSCEAHHPIPQPARPISPGDAVVAVAFIPNAEQAAILEKLAAKKEAERVAGRQQEQRLAAEKAADKVAAEKAAAEKEEKITADLRARDQAMLSDPNWRRTSPFATKPDYDVAEGTIIRSDSTKEQNHLDGHFVETTVHPLEGRYSL